MLQRRGLVFVKMVITEEKILSNIEKVERLINPNSKKQIIELDDSSYFKDLVESIKTYLIEYPKKKNFPKNVYDEAYKLVEFATNQFEENTKQIEELIKQREYNIKSAAILKQTLEIAKAKGENWQQSVVNISDRFSEDVIDALNVIGKSKDDNEENVQAAIKLITARIANLQSNLHIEIDMERVEDRSKALSYIGIEIADALKLIPAPLETAQNTAPAEVVATPAKEKAKVKAQAPAQAKVNVAAAKPVKQEVPQTAVVVENKNTASSAYQAYYADTRREVKASLWNRFQNSKFMQAIKFALKIRVVLQLPEGLPSGEENK